MRDIRKHAPRLGTFSLITACLTFALWRYFFSKLWSFGFDPRHCPGAPRDLGSWLIVIGASLFIGAIVLSVASVVLGLAALKPRPILMGVAAAVISLGNISNLPSGHGWQVSDSTAIAWLRTINAAEITHLSSSSGRYGTISDLVKMTLLDPRFEEPPVGGYTYDIVIGDGTYVATATPFPGFPGVCWEYYSTQDAHILYSKDPMKAPEGRAGTPVQ